LDHPRDNRSFQRCARNLGVVGAPLRIASGALNADKRRLIVTADDFGRSPGINRGIIAANEVGIVTSAKFMVRWPAAAGAAAYARERPDLALGLHFDLGE
jgi:hypothetical protein